MTESRHSRDAHPPIWGIFLIYVGIIFLLQSLGKLPWSLWGNLWHFWPVLIIIAGLAILLGPQKPWLTVLLVFILLGASLGIAIRQNRSEPAQQTATTYTQIRAGLQNAQVALNFQAGRATLAGLASGAANLVEAGYTEGSLTPDFRRNDSVGILNLRSVPEPPAHRQGTIDWAIKLTPDIPLTINMDTSASDINLDMSRLQVTQFDLQANAVQCKITVPSSGKTQTTVTANVANVEITVPAGVAARIDEKTSLTTLNIDQSRFPLSNGVYVSPDFATATNQLNLKINCNVGMVRIK